MPTLAWPSDYEQRLSNGHSPAFRVHIIILRLTILAALSLIPLLAWHNAMTHLSDKYDMPRMWEEDFRESQLSGSKVWVWVFMWIFIPLDILHVLLCLAWYHEILHPQTREGNDAARGNDEQETDPSYGGTKGPDEQQQPTNDGQKSALAPISRFSAITKSCYEAQTRILLIKNLFTSSHPETPLTYHPLLHAMHPPSGRFLLLASYDTLLTIVLALHIYTYVISIQPSMAFCYTKAVRFHPNSAFEPLRNIIAAKDVNFPFLNMEERCERLNWNIHIAGGFASTIAAILAATHLAALVCRLHEGLYSVLERGMRKQRTKYDGMQLEQMESSCQNPPRDVDIHTRNSGKSNRLLRTKGRLTKISEEEIRTGGEVTRRRQISKSQSNKSARSKSSSGDSGRLEHVLLECLVP